MVIFASEDVGLADPNALPLAVSVKEAVHFVGMPEGRINLGPRRGLPGAALRNRGLPTNAVGPCEPRKYAASGARPVPMHIRNAPTKLMKDLGYGKGEAESGLPEGLHNRRFLRREDD